MRYGRTARVLWLVPVIIVSLFTVLQAATAPKIKLKDLEGKEFTLEQALASGPVLLDFWATWCAPCIKAMPKLIKLKDKYESQGLTVVTVNEDGPRNLVKVRLFLKKHKLDFRVLLDLNSAVMNRYRINSLPATVLIAPSGEISYFHRGYKPGDEIMLEEEILKILE